MERPFPIVNQKSLIINGETVRAETRYYPWGQDNRWKVNVTPTGARFTNQRLDDTLNLYNYNARYYDHWIGRFISADTIVPGQNRLTPLTVGFHETAFLNKISEENRQMMLMGSTFTWSASDKQKLGIPSGTFSPQFLNHYTYSLNNPLGYVDPTGHASVSIELTAEQAQKFVDFWLNVGGEIGWAEILHDIGQGMVIAGFVLSALEALLGGLPLIIPTLGIGLGGGEIAKETADTLKEIAEFVKAELDAGTESITITVEDYLLGEKIIVQGQNTESTFAPAVADDAGKVLLAWMLYSDNDAPVMIDGMFGAYWWRGTDGSIAFP